MITAQVEGFRDRLEELKPLLPAHYDLLSVHKEKGFPLRPQYANYFAREAAGVLLFVTLRKDGLLIGYWIGNIAPGEHYETCLTSIMDIWNILPEFMPTIAPKILFDAVHREMKRRGVNLSFMGEKLHRPCGRLFELYGYKPMEKTYAKWLEV